MYSLIIFSEVTKKFDGQGWASNGPNLVTRVIKRSCDNRLNLKNTSVQRCGNFSILPRSKCYAIHYTNWAEFFEADKFQSVKAQIAESYFVHWWNQMSKNRKFEKGSKTALDYLFKRFCPLVYKTM